MSFLSPFRPSLYCSKLCWEILNHRKALGTWHLNEDTEGTRAAHCSLSLVSKWELLRSSPGHWPLSPEAWHHRSFLHSHWGGREFCFVFWSSHLGPCSLDFWKHLCSPLFWLMQSQLFPYQESVLHGNPGNYLVKHQWALQGSKINRVFTTNELNSIG
jgi:hypothetical protein